MQKSRAIGLSLFSYANDNNGNYPNGKNSTEVFQKLLDEKYVADPAAFYLPLPGKIRPVDGQKLKPENVGFDITSGVDSNSPDQLPVVFMTGYKVAYIPGGMAVPILPSFTGGRTWSQWWDNEPVLRSSAGIAVTYKGNNSIFIKMEPSSNSNGTIPHFISLDFKPNGKTYRQLTPDGVLPP